MYEEQDNARIKKGEVMKKCEGCKFGIQKDFESGECFVPMACAYCVRFYTAKSDKFEPAEPMVLSAEDWAEQFLRSKQTGLDYPYPIRTVDLETAHKAGQIGEYNKPEQVELRNFVERMRGDANSYRHDAARVLENLKPPYEDEDELS